MDTILEELQIRKEIRALILEDEIGILDSLCEALEKLDGLHIIPCSNHDEAERIILAGECDIYITDLRINIQPEGRRQTQFNAALLLSLIKKIEFSVPSIARSQYTEKLKEVSNENLANHSIDKTEDALFSKTLKAAKELSMEISLRREKLHDALLAIYSASSSKDLGDATSRYLEAREIILEIRSKDWNLSNEWDSGIWAVWMLVCHLGPIPIPKMNISQFNPSHIGLIHEFLSKLIEPDFRFSKNYKIIAKLESLGYTCAPSIDLSDIDLNSDE